MECEALPTYSPRRIHKPQRARTGANLFVINSNDPSYLPPTQGQVAEIATMVKGLWDELKPLGLSAHDEAKYSFDHKGINQTVKFRFEKLSSEWQAASSLCSSLLEMATLPSYQQIIGMGRPAISYILRELSRQPDHWFWALKAISGEDPVQPEDRGDLQKMTQAWLVWGARNGFEF